MTILMLLIAASACSSNISNDIDGSYVQNEQSDSINNSLDSQESTDAYANDDQPSQAIASDGRKIITIATDFYTLEEEVNEFNLSNNDYIIEVKQYDLNSAEQLYSEISDGIIPDIFCFGPGLMDSAFNASRFAASGILTDLYELLDSDDTLSRESFHSQILSLAEKNGAIYELPATFYLITLSGDSEIIGSLGDEWTIDNLEELMESRPSVKYPFGPNVTSFEVLQHLLAVAYDDLIDWKNGTVDSQLLDQIFRMAEMQPLDSLSVSQQGIISDGKQLFHTSIVPRASMLQQTYGYLGTDNISFAGFPSEIGAGNAVIYNLSFSISEACENKDTAWDFIKQFYADDRITVSFPVNSAALDKRLEAASEYESSFAGTLTLNEGDVRYSIAIGEPTDTDVDRIYELLENIRSIYRLDSVLSDVVNSKNAEYSKGILSGDKVFGAIQQEINSYVNS